MKFTINNGVLYLPTDVAHTLGQKAKQGKVATIANDLRLDTDLSLSEARSIAKQMVRDPGKKEFSVA